MSTATAHGAAPRPRNTLALLFAGFVLTGISTVIVGPVLPVFISRWSLDDSQAGLFFTVQFAVALAGVLLSSALTARWGFRPAIVLGYLFLSIGMIALNAPTHAVALVATAFLGGGYGLIVPGGNLFVAECGGSRNATLLSVLNFSWGVGAVVCSPLILLALKGHSLSLLLTTYAVIGFLITLGFLFVSFAAASPADSPSAVRSAAPTPALWITVVLAALFFVYVGIETSIGGWAAEHAKRMAQGTGLITTLAPMFFYAGLTAGRALVPLVLLRVREIHLMFAALALTTVGTTVVIASVTLPVAVCGVATAGLGCACVYPMLVAWFSRWYGPAARALGAIMFSLASLGGAAVPLLVGFVSKEAGNLRIGLLVPLAGILLIAMLLLPLRRLTST